MNHGRLSKESAVLFFATWFRFRGYFFTPSITAL
jgi:hypothetical protein